MNFTEAYAALDNVKAFIKSLEPATPPPPPPPDPDPVITVNVDHPSQINSAILSAGPGGRVVVKPGDYRMTSGIGITNGGGDGMPVTIVGDGVTIFGNRNDDNESVKWVPGSDISSARNVKQQPMWGPLGINLFNLQAGANNLTFKGFLVSQVARGFQLTAPVHDVTFDGLKFYNCQDYIWQRYDAGFAGHKNLTYRNLHGVGFSKSAIRIDGPTEDVLIEDCFFDSGFLSNDEFAMGIFLRMGRRIVIRRVTIGNCVDIEAAGTYWNGDGITIEREVDDVLIEDYTAYGCSDGGIDTKGTKVRLVRPNIYGCKNNIRVWGEIEITDGQVANPTKAKGAPWGDPGGGTGSTTNVMAIGAPDATKQGALVILKGDFKIIGSPAGVSPHAHGSAGGKIYNLTIDDQRSVA